MTIINWLVENMQKLQISGVDSPRRDCLVLLEDTLGKNRAWVISHPEYKLEELSLKKLNNLIKRRLKREPLAYIRGKAWFYGRFFDVNPKVMIPRPETEAFIEIIKKLKPQELIDLGTGSGCLAITTKLELPKCSVFAYDIDRITLKTAIANAKKHNVEVSFKTSDLLLSVEEYSNSHDKSKVNSVLVANLPYVPNGLPVSKEVFYEPSQAVFSGTDGLDHYKSFWLQISKLQLKPQHILTESLLSQHGKIVRMAKDAGYLLQQTSVLVQHFVKK